MTDGAVIRAPGKLVLAGEYAVLDGAPAMVLAVDRGVQCTLAPSDMVRIETPDGDDRFVRPALMGAPPAIYRFSVWNPTGLAEKPGFGGSAAACVAACVAAGREPTDAFDIHAQVQGGGSGVDIAASLYGGMMRFQGGAVTPLDPIVPVVVWSGQSARTGPMVDRYLAWTDRAAFVQASTTLVDGFTDDPVAAVQENGQLLMDMATQSGVPFMTPALARIAGLARRHGGAAKPSGAGGGDCAVALFRDSDAQTAFVAACQQAGLTVIPVSVAAGVM